MKKTLQQVEGERDELYEQFQLLNTTLKEMHHLEQDAWNDAERRAALAEE